VPRARGIGHAGDRKLEGILEASTAATPSSRDYSLDAICPAGGVKGDSKRGWLTARPRSGEAQPKPDWGCKGIFSDSSAYQSGGSEQMVSKASRLPGSACSRTSSDQRRSDSGRLGRVGLRLEDRCRSKRD